MPLQVRIPVSTEVIENNPDCQIEGIYAQERIVILIDTRHQHHHQRLRLSTQTALHWGEEV